MQAFLMRVALLAFLSHGSSDPVVTGDRHTSLLMAMDHSHHMCGTLYLWRLPLQFVSILHCTNCCMHRCKHDLVGVQAYVYDVVSGVVADQPFVHLPARGFRDGGIQEIEVLSAYADVHRGGSRHAHWCTQNWDERCRVDVVHVDAENLLHSRCIWNDAYHGGGIVANRHPVLGRCGGSGRRAQQGHRQQSLL